MKRWKLPSRAFCLLLGTSLGTIRRAQAATSLAVEQNPPRVYDKSAFDLSTTKSASWELNDYLAMYRDASRDISSSSCCDSSQPTQCSMSVDFGRSAISCLLSAPPVSFSIKAQSLRVLFAFPSLEMRVFDSVGTILVEAKVIHDPSILGFHPSFGSHQSIVPPCCRNYSGRLERAS